MCPRGARHLQLLVEVPHHHDELQLGGAVFEHAALPGLLALQVVPLDPPQQLKQGRHGHNPAAMAQVSGEASMLSLGALQRAQKLRGQHAAQAQSSQGLMLSRVRR